MDKVLVTGASGFIGKTLVPYLLEQGYQVRCFVRLTSDTTYLKTLGVELVFGDLSDKVSLRSAMNRVDSVYHLAGQIYSSAKETYDEVNAKGTANVLEAACQQKRPPVVLSVSSLAAAGPRKNGEKPTEASPTQPVSQYGESKRESENQLRKFADRVPISVVRPPLVFGAGDTATMPIFKSVKTGIHAAVGKNTQFTLVYVNDLVRLMVEIVTKGERLTSVDNHDGKGLYFAGYHDSISWEQLGEWIAEAMGRSKPWIVRIPGPVLKLVGALSEVLSSITNKPMVLSRDKAREGTGGHWVCDVKKGHDQFEFTPEKSLKEALSDTVIGYRELGLL